MPSDVTPRMVVTAMVRPPGSVAPGGASAVRRPGATLGAPQMTDSLRSGSATRHSRLTWPGRDSPSSRSMASISPTTTPPSPSTTGAARLHGNAGVGEAIGEDGGRQIDIDVLAQPAVRDLHRLTLPRARTAARKRRSFSKNRRMSSTLVLEHGDALDAHPEGPAGHFLGIVAHVAEHVRVHHPRAEDLEPAALLADAAAVAAADEAQHVDLGRGLGEREERRPEARSRARAEHLAGEQLERALEVGHGDVRSTASPSTWWNIGEWVASVRRADRPCPAQIVRTGGRLRLHGADLDRRGVGAQERVARRGGSVSCMSRAGWSSGKLSAAKL